MNRLSSIVGWYCAPWADVIDPKPFDELLKSYVDRRGRVDYAGLKANEADLKALNDFVYESNRGDQVWFVEDIEVLNARFSRCAN